MSTQVREFYNNDIIYRFDKRNRLVFGMVLDTYESTDPTDSNSLAKGQLLVDWGNIEKNYVVRQKNVRLLSRRVVPGDIVRRLEHGKETQRGYCRSMQMFANVHILGSDKLIENVPHHRIKTMYPLSLNSPACLGEKFGRMVALTYLITLSSQCGAILEVKSHISSIEFSSVEECFFVGQSIVSRASNLGKIKWIKKSKATERDVPHRYVVEKIKPICVLLEVYALQGPFTYIYEVTEEDIPKLETLQLTDNYMTFNELRLLKLISTDTVLSKNEWIAKQSEKFSADMHPMPKFHRCPVKKEHTVSRVYYMKSQLGYPACSCRHRTRVRTSVKSTDPEDNDWSTEEEEEQLEVQKPLDDQNVKAAKKIGLSVPVQLIYAEYRPTIVWQDGTEEKDVPTDQLYYSISLDDHEFFCGDWVIRADGTLDDYGVVQKVDYLARTATIKWFVFCCEAQKPIFSSKKEMSVYDIKKHPAFMFRPGSIVHRNELSERNLGQVVDSYPEGFVKVRWMTGFVEDCWPQHLSLFGTWLDDTMNFSDEEAPSVMSWQTESVESFMGEQHISGGWRNLYNRLDFMRTRLCFLKDAMKDVCCSDNKFDTSKFVAFLAIYENSVYLDKLLGTSYFSLTDPDYQALLKGIKEFAAKRGLPLDTSQSYTNLNANIDANQCVPCNSVCLPECLNNTAASESSTSTEKEEVQPLCLKFISMLKTRLDLAFSMVMFRIKSHETVSVSVVKSPEATNITPMTSTPLQSIDSTPDDSFTSITNTPLPCGETNALDWFGQGILPNLIGNQSPPKFGESDIQAMNKWIATSETLISATSPTKQTVASNNGCGVQFEVLEEAPRNHSFYNKRYDPVNFHQFLRAVSNENKLLRESLPPGVWVYTFADRMDLHTVMIRGPDYTPYENGLFIFNLQLSPDYPNTPPTCDYISYNSERLNPNLYVEGKVCVSLLGTWVGRGSEVWRPTSTLLQLIVSIQGLILVAEPYYNEAGYEKQCNSQQGYENSRTYNELVILRLVQSMTQMIETPYTIFTDEIYKHFREHGEKLIKRLSGWINNDFTEEPQFPLLPVSKGLKLSLEAALQEFQKAYQKHVMQITKT